MDASSPTQTPGCSVIPGDDTSIVNNIARSAALTRHVVLRAHSAKMTTHTSVCAIAGAHSGRS